MLDTDVKINKNNKQKYFIKLLNKINSENLNRF
nr:MAG TPA: hypothetical protein [Caudoviricetes sp.]